VEQDIASAFQGESSGSDAGDELRQ
jgi:hypothetical protein